MAEQYDHKTIEKKWQEKWDKDKLYKALDNSKIKKYYTLVEFPFPSGAGLHTGHIRSYTAMDIIARKRRSEGHNVLYPMGWDAFGLPTENFAIKTGIQPKDATKQNTDNFRKQLKSLGYSFDWSREINTTDPKYYKWTQWIFLKLYEKGLAYKAKMMVNWCPKDLIVLANEEVINGCCERCGTPVEKKEKEQWMLAITKYADRLDKDLDTVDYLEKIKIQQRNWIGRSEGAEISFPIVIKNNKPRFVILHGFEGSAKTNFIPWLKKELENRGYEVEAPELPNSNNPKETEQVDFVLKNCTFDENTVIVAHSLGGVVAMKVLPQLKTKISGLVLVATARDKNFKGAPKQPYWDGFTWDLDYEAIKKSLNVGTAIISDLREKDRLEYLRFLTEKLGANLLEVESSEEHFTALEEPAILKAVTPSIKVFTTRPDTLFGATYMVLAPEHPLIEKLKSKISNWDEVLQYIVVAKSKTEIDRTNAEKEKTGVELKGIKAINPANNEEIPIWIADYVLAHYGTGAIMAVPAHDERDFAFATKFNLPIRQVIEPIFVDKTAIGAYRPEVKMVERNGIVAIVKHWKDDTYICLKWKKVAWTTWITGGIEPSQTAETAAVAEIIEETGYKHPVLKKNLGKFHSLFYHPPKGENRLLHGDIMYFELKDGERNDISQEENENHDVEWKTVNELKKLLTAEAHQHALAVFLGEKKAFTEPGLLIESGEFNGKNSLEIQKAITEFVGGEMKVTYKLRDWVFSRQRYWGEPIPMIWCEKDKWVPVPEKDLPVVLPEVKKYEPSKTGESPLAEMTDWVNTTCPKCGGKATRETDTMPNWAGSSWYYLRYADPHNDEVFASKKNLEYWTPVDWYNGGMEHTTLHLLYSRFWHKFLFDQGLVPTSEPYQKRTSHGLILALGGEKMSKSKGNVVNPDELVEMFGADSLRLYEMFMGPFDQAIAWNSDNILGPRRFIETVWRMSEKVSDMSDNEPIGNLKHVAIKKVSEDIEKMAFNTAVSTLMIYSNTLTVEEKIPKEDFETLLKLLAPFAPHITEELWENLGHANSIHTEAWPSYDEKKLIAEKSVVIFQVNGKVRSSIEIRTGASEEEVKKAFESLPEAQKWLQGKEIKKVIFVPNKLINFVIQQ